MDVGLARAHRRDKTFAEEFGLPQTLSYDLSTVPLDRAMTILDDPTEFRAVLREFFQFRDRNQKGGLDREELAEVCVQIYQQLGTWEEWTAEPTKAQLDEVFARCDINKSGLVEFDEFHAAAKRILTKIACNRTTSGMWEHQAKLKRLPIPPLPATLERFGAAVTPLLSRDDAARLREVLAAFSAQGGAQLDAIVRARYNPDGGRPGGMQAYNYVEEMWAQMYATWRVPLPVFVSPSVLFLPSKKVGHNRQLLKGARFASELIKLMSFVHFETLKPDVIRSTPLCMWEYQFTFARYRQPRLGADVNIVNSPRPPREIEQANIEWRRASPTTILVMRKHRLFILDVFHSDGTVLSAGEILVELEAIEAAAVAADAAASAPPLGAFTADERDTWARNRQRLVELSERNAANLAAVEGTVLCLCLDDISPDPVSSTALKWMLHGDGRNRWFDCAMQIYVCRNGVAGMQFEHSACDAWPYIRLIVEIGEELHSEKFTPEIRRATPAPPYAGSRHRELVFDMSEELAAELKGAEKRVDGLIARTAVRYLTAPQVGKEQITSQLASPDAVVQAALCAAFHRTRKVLPNVYSAGGTKIFQHGRTECVRTLGQPMVDFLNAYAAIHPRLHPPSDGVGPAPAKLKPGAAELISLNAVLRKALDAHQKKMVEAKLGNGCDRHLFAMYCTAKVMRGMAEAAGGAEAAAASPCPALFSDPAWAKAMDFTLSTSNVPPNPHALSQVFGPTSETGYGVCYSVYNTHMTFGLTQLRNEGGDDIDTFKCAVEDALADIVFRILPAKTRSTRLMEWLYPRYLALRGAVARRLGFLTRVPLLGMLLTRMPPLSWTIGRLLTPPPRPAAVLG